MVECVENAIGDCLHVLMICVDHDGRPSRSHETYQEDRGHLAT